MPLRTRSRSFGSRELTAAAAEVDIALVDDQKYVRSTVSTTRSSGLKPWKWYDEIGEVHYATARSARIAGYARLQCVRLAPDGSVEDIVDDGIAADIVNQIRSPYGGSRGLIERFYTLMKVPADSWLLEVRDEDDMLDGYHFLSADEMDVSSFSSWRPSKRGRLRWVTVPAVPDESIPQFSREIDPAHLLGRVWSPSKRYAEVADSALAALNDECEQLYMLTKSVKAKLLSRFATAGLLFIPDTISTARVTNTQPTIAGQNIDATLNYIIRAMTTNMKTWEEAITYLPILLRGAADAGEQIKHIVMDQEVFDTDIELRRELIGRILQGLDANQDMTQGTSDQSHFSAWAASDEERRIAVQPDLEMMCWALTTLVLHKRLLEDGMNPEEVALHAVWYDLTRSTVRANQQEDARQLVDRGLIGDESARRMSGVGETEAPDDAERIRYVGRMTRNPYLMLWDHPEFENIDWDVVKQTGVKTGPTEKSPADDSEAGPGEGDPGSPDDRETDTPRADRPV